MLIKDNRYLMTHPEPLLVCGDKEPYLWEYVNFNTISVIWLLSLSCQSSLNLNELMKVCRLVHQSSLQFICH